jgi:hypothetical protein
MTLDNATYNKIKTICTLSKLCWFIEKHALEDAQKAGDKASLEDLKALHHDLQKHIEKLQQSMCIITQ